MDVAFLITYSVSAGDHLTHLSMDKMVTISQTIFRWNFVNKKIVILIKMSLKFVSKGPIDHFADDIFRWNFVNKKIVILIEMPLKFVPKGPIDNNPALV